ncbi:MULTISPECIES: 3-deoxy-manno-octulosonate cytidylyltransferase [Pseudomonas]|uniref:3-deoxy-manno-octulosonate cytidylyltransferase n=1 Tax=Pseudomonas TaxID=286 RepID=UPI001E42DAFB|nr:3-deoxy-manno-octulosonate cytidylyltransferase [Pseudomonas alloputida]MCE1058296.1 3-deoxy-manno-octulosonate cytidylyltransferase [Pseudomonas alloputida]
MASYEHRVAIVIPARYGSTRLPGKPLADIAGKPMIQHVYERAVQVAHADVVIIATDDERVAQAVRSFGGEYIMTSSDHLSGTDRLAEVMKSVDADIYINLQGDEPLVRPKDVDTLIRGMISDASVQVGTLCHPIDAREAASPNSVKVVLANSGNALYFSRSPIPYPREKEAAKYLKHIGVYAYRKHIIADYLRLQQPMIENSEKLEQLRLLAAGYCIRAFEVAYTAPGVDTAECLEKVRAIVSGRSLPKKPELMDVRLVITDVDGVLTDGGIYYDATGECLKRFHVRDGMGMRLLEENGVRVAVVSGRDSAALRKRVTDLGISLCEFGVKDKFAACEQLMIAAGVDKAQTACIGDDSIDLPAFEACGLSFAVADAPSYIKDAATYTLNTVGGSGAFREVADAILQAQGKQMLISTSNGYSKLMNKMTQ